MNRGLLFIIMTGIIIFTATVHIQFAEAKNVATTKYPNLISVEYSQSCITMLKNHVKTECPTLDKLVKYDNTNQYYSGKFINGNTSRTNPTVKNHYIFYDKPTVCIDCKIPLAAPDVFRVIFLESHDFVYVDHSQVIKNYTYNTYSGRYVSPDCMYATIGYSDSLLNDTIKYMESNCTITSFNGNKTNTIKDVPFKLDSPYSSLKHYAWLKEVKKSPVQDCITKKCVTPPNPYHKKGW